MTNADRKIRTASNEEIAKLFTGFEYDGVLRFICPVQERIGEGRCASSDLDCRECFLAWLNKEED